MNAHVLLNLLNELGKRDIMRGLLSILCLFRIEINKFNNTRARMLDSIYHMTLKILNNHFFGVRFCHLLRNVIMLCYTLICKSLVVYRFYCMPLFDSQTRCHVII